MNTPVIILVEPQLPQNIGMAARAMANFGLADMRLVAPREGWPNPDAVGPSAGADHVLSQAQAYATTEDAVADLTFVIATTARSRGQMKRVLAADEGLGEVARREASGQRTGILFGRERTGLGNDDVSLCDAIMTYPVDPGFGSVNLAGAVLIAGYEWAKAAGAGTPFRANPGTAPATREAVVGLFGSLEGALDEAGFYPPEKRSSMIRNMRDMFHRMSLTEQDVRTWRGAIRVLAEGRAEGRARRKV